jgi:hypothetical protein
VRLPEGDRSFRLLLFARAPDRLHAEVLGPVGGPQLVVDSGSGRLAVAFPGERVAYQGDADAGAIERVLGVRVAPAELVAFLTEGAPPASQGLRAEREPAVSAGLPRRVRLAAADASLTLERRERRPPPADPDALGTGAAPDGFEVRPLADLPDLLLGEERP